MSKENKKVSINFKITEKERDDFNKNCQNSEWRHTQTVLSNFVRKFNKDAKMKPGN